MPHFFTTVKKWGKERREGRKPKKIHRTEQINVKLTVSMLLNVWKLSFIRVPGKMAKPLKPILKGGGGGTHL